MCRLSDAACWHACSGSGSTHTKDLSQASNDPQSGLALRWRLAVGEAQHPGQQVRPLVGWQRELGHCNNGISS